MELLRIILNNISINKRSLVNENDKDVYINELPNNFEIHENE